MYQNDQVDNIIKNWRPKFGNPDDIRLKSLIDEYKTLEDKQEDDLSDAVKDKNNERIAHLAGLIIGISTKK